jgi:hypothetical protein
MSADTVLGLPGMLCTISAAREIISTTGRELAQVPVHLYGPQGLAEFVRCAQGGAAGRQGTRAPAAPAAHPACMPTLRVRPRCAGRPVLPARALISFFCIPPLSSRTVLNVSKTYLEPPIVVHEFVPGPVPPEAQAPRLLDRRAKLHVALLPPDQLNERG